MAVMNRRRWLDDEIPVAGTTPDGGAPIRSEIRDYLEAKAAPPAAPPPDVPETGDPNASPWKSAAVLAALSGIGGIADSMSAEGGQKTNFGGNIADIFSKSVEAGVNSKREAVRRALEEKKTKQLRDQWEAEMTEKKRQADMEDKRARDVAAMTADSKTKTREEAAESKADTNKQREEDKRENRIQSIRKEITGSKSYQGWLDIKNASDNLAEAVANPSSKRTIGAIYSYVKALDPGSVVREGEIRLAGEARSLATRIEASLRRMAKGEVMTPAEIKELADWAKAKEQIARKTAISSNKPAISQAQRLEFDLGEVNADLFGQEAEQEAKDQPDEHGYVVGQQYKMRDGNMATYLGNGEFE